MKTYIKSRTCIVFTKNKSILDILSNNIAFGKSWRSSTQYTCHCKMLHTKYLLPVNKEGHIQINSKDIKEGPFEKLFNRNCRDKCKPDLTNFHSYFQEAMNTYKSSIYNLVKEKSILSSWFSSLENQIQDMYEELILHDKLQEKNRYPSNYRMQSLRSELNKN